MLCYVMYVCWTQTDRQTRKPRQASVAVGRIYVIQAMRPANNNNNNSSSTAIIDTTGPLYRKILRQSYDHLAIMPKIPST